jgi:hypothetical protein
MFVRIIPSGLTANAAASSLPEGIWALAPIPLGLNANMSHDSGRFGIPSHFVDKATRACLPYRFIWARFSPHPHEPPARAHVFPELCYCGTFPEQRNINDTTKQSRWSLSAADALRSLAPNGMLP